MRGISIGNIESKILSLIEEYGGLHFSLIDPDKVSFEDVDKLACRLEDLGTSAILVGGSTGISESHLDDIVKAIKSSVNIPVILFPGNITGISRYADAILFMSLLNSDDPYFITGAQLLGSIIVKRYKLEAIPTAYIIIGEGGTAGYIGRARPVPEDKHDIIALYVLTASYMGMRFVYLEKGSGAKTPVSPEAINMSKKLTSNITLIVGGGIRGGDQAYSLVRAGADIIVTGTIIEEDIEKVKDIVKAVREAGRERLKLKT